MNTRYHMYASITIFFWSLAYVFTKLALRHFSPFSLGFLRYAIASLALISAARVTSMTWPKKKDLPMFALSGLVGFFLYMIAFNQGQLAVSAATASIVIAAVPVLTAFLAWGFYKEQLRGMQWLAILIEFVGVAVLVLLNGAFSVNSGLLWLVLAAILLSTYNMLQRKLTVAYTALQTTTFSILAGTIFLTIFSPGAYRELLTASPVDVSYVLILGLFSSAVAYFFWAKALAAAPQTSHVTNYMFLTPLITSILGFLIANELPDTATLLGGSIILGGALVFQVGQKR